MGCETPLLQTMRRTNISAMQKHLVIKQFPVDQIIHSEKCTSLRGKIQYLGLKKTFKVTCTDQESLRKEGSI